jgi:hypothetical protein
MVRILGEVRILWSYCMRFPTSALLSLVLLIEGVSTALGAGLDAELLKVRAIGPRGEGHEQAIEAIRKVSQAELDQLIEILDAMKAANPLARNWLRSAAERVVQRGDNAKQSMPTTQLVDFLRNTANDPHARRLAYEILVAHDAGFAGKWNMRFLDDPSLELRRDSVQVLLDQADKLNKAADSAAAADKFGAALMAARDLDQITSAAAALEELGTKVNVNDVMGFIMSWHLAAPFDNTDKAGFDVAYPPEKGVDLKATYSGKDDTVRWIAYKADAKFGIIDLNEAIAKHKGTIGYAYAEFFAESAREVEIRIGCINANKVWLNGKLLTTNHVYHANMFVDQYKGIGRIKAGKNTILLKIAQNEQTEDWAQRWQFQLRVCDALGGAVKSTK